MQAQSLAGNVRLLKSEIRAESVIKSWERWRGLKNLAATGNIAFTHVNGTQFTVNDNFTGTRLVAVVGRRVRAFLTGSTIYGTISAAVFSSPDTTVTVVWDSGSMDATLSEVQFGVELRAMPSLVGDVSGAFGANTVDKIKGVAVSGTGPTTDQFLAYNGTLWVPTSLLKAANGGTGINTSASTGVPRIATGTWSVLAQLLAALGGTGIDTSGSTGVPRIDAGTWSVVADSLARKVVKTADQTVNASSALQNDTHLFFPMAANKSYHFDLNIITSSANTTADFKIGWTVPALCTMLWAPAVFANSSSQISPTAAQWAVKQTDEQTVAALVESDTRTFAGATSNHLVKFSGIVRNGANADNLQLQWAQNTANASDSKFLKDSHIIYRELN